MEEALESVRQQTYTTIEVIVSDDASSDNTLEILKRFKNRVEFPVFIYSHIPNGIGANWNNCIKKANGEYIKFLFQDDVLVPTCVEQMVQLHESYPKAGLVACKRAFIINDNLKTKDTEKWIANYGDLQKDIPIEDKIDHEVISKVLFKSPNFFESPLNKIGEPSTYLFRTDLVKRIGYFRQDLNQILDYEFCYRILKTKSILVIKEKLVKFRLHQDQATQLNKGNDADDYKIYNSIINQEYFWYFNRRKQIQILRLRYPILNFLFSLKTRLG